MLLARFLRLLGKLFIAAPLALPDREHCVRIVRVLINRALRRNDLSATPRTCAPARRALFNVNLKQFSYVCHLISQRRVITFDDEKR